jgi:hypothetical protein
LFIKDIGYREFKFISGTKGRFGLCLSMTEPCFGHDSGTFIIKMALQKYISKSGTWKFKTVLRSRAFAKEITMGFRYWKS